MQMFTTSNIGRVGRTTTRAIKAIRDFTLRDPLARPRRQKITSPGGVGPTAWDGLDGTPSHRQDHVHVGFLFQLSQIPSLARRNEETDDAVLLVPGDPRWNTAGDDKPASPGAVYMEPPWLINVRRAT